MATATVDERKLLQAAEDAKLDAVKALIAKGVNVECTDPRGYTPMHHAASAGDLDVVKFLEESGADIGAKNLNGSVPLHFAALKGHMHIAKFFIDKGADMNALNLGGQSPLFRAAYSGDKAMATLLMDNGTDKTIKSKFGRTAADEARRVENHDIADFIESYAAAAGGDAAVESGSAAADAPADDAVASEPAAPEASAVPDAAPADEPKAAPAANGTPATGGDGDLELVRAKYNFDGEQDTDLTFKKNDVIMVLAKEEDGWWEGKTATAQGLFPGNYTLPYEGDVPEWAKGGGSAAVSSSAADSAQADDDDLPAPPTATTDKELVRAKHKFPGEEDGDLSFDKNAVIVVLAKADDGWWEGRTATDQGMFPGNYVVPYEGEVPDWVESA